MGSPVATPPGTREWTSGHDRWVWALADRAGTVTPDGCPAPDPSGRRSGSGSGSVRASRAEDASRSPLPPSLALLPAFPPVCCTPPVFGLHVKPIPVGPLTFPGDDVLLRRVVTLAGRVLAFSRDAESLLPGNGNGRRSCGHFCPSDRTGSPQTTGNSALSHPPASSVDLARNLRPLARYSAGVKRPLFTSEGQCQPKFC